MRLGRRGHGDEPAPLSKRALLQHVNGELWALAADDAPLEVYCECGRDDCILSVDVAHADFAAARAHPSSAIVVAEHASADEPVLERFESFLVVGEQEAVGGARRVAAERRSAAAGGDDPFTEEG